jgi:AcrR family transcriptional regulator
MSDTNTGDRILNIAHKLLSSGGLGAVSFDSIARELGKSKQAVLYWYPTKRDLLAALFLPWLEAEARTAIAALAGRSGRDEAIAAFVRAVAAFHFADLDRFRMIYLVPQTTGIKAKERQDAIGVEQVHPVTARLYDALAGHLEGDPDAARAEAVAIHAAVLGQVLLFALGQALQDPLKQSQEDLADALIASLTERQSRSSFGGTA